MVETVQDRTRVFFHLDNHWISASYSPGVLYGSKKKMLKKVENAKKIAENSANGKFLNENESTSKTARFDRNRSMNSRKVVTIRSKSIRRTHLADKKSKLQNASEETPWKATNKKSIWGWKSLKALSHIGNRPFKCRFFLQVHSVEGLPSDFDGTTLSVNWKNRDGSLTSHPAKVFQGMAEFEQQLSYTCSVYASRNGVGSNRPAKYEAKHFWLYASSCEAPELDLGKHQIDLTRLLPVELKKLEENSSANWTTSFKLSGIAEGASINVSFRYSVIGDDCISADKGGNVHDSFISKYDNCSIGKSDVKFGEGDELYIIRRAESLPSKINRPSLSSSSSFEDIKELHEILPRTQSDSVNLAGEKDQNLGEDETNKFDKCGEHSPSSDIEKRRTENGCGVESLVVEKGQVKSEELALVQSEEKGAKLAKVSSNDDLVGSELNITPLKMSSDSEPESPRERLLRKFEKEALANGHSMFDFNAVDGEGKDSDKEELRRQISASPKVGNGSQGSELSTLIEAMEEHQITLRAERNKTNAKYLEGLEAETLMREWGLNEKSFQHSPSISGGFGSPIDFPLGEPLEMRLPPLGEGLGAFLQTKTGGFLRSMNLLIFQNAKCGGSLIMQISSLVVLPAEMGSEIMQILQCLASVGIHKLSMQLNKVMPLEDIMGKTMQQVAWEAASGLEKSERQSSLLDESILNSEKRVRRRSFAKSTKRFCSNQLGEEVESEYISLEDLAPLAMDKIETLTIEGLRIQSGLSDADAPSNISAKPIGELEGNAELHLLNSHNDVDGLMGLSLTLDEWTRLDSGELEKEDYMGVHTSEILAAHQANSLDFINDEEKGERKRSGSKRCGRMGSNFTVAFMVHLQDPLRNYEPVGAPMLALVQVERTFLDQNQRFRGSVSDLKNSCECKSSDKKDREEERKEKNTLEDEDNVLQFRIRDVHVAGVKTDSAKKVWGGTSAHQKSGSRWLLANGMGKRSKLSFFISMAASKSYAAKTTKRQPGNILWSISSCVNAKGEAIVRYVRNPNLVFPTETVTAR